MKFKIVGAASALVAALGVQPAIAQVCAPAGDAARVITLQEAVGLALAHDLRPETARAGIAAARTELAIAALQPADALSLEVENFPGLGSSANIDNVEITGSFSRVWERGGKREARSRLADSGVAVATAGVWIAQADITYEVRTLYVELAIAHERLALAMERLASAQSAEALIERRVEAARDPLLAGARAAADTMIAQGDTASLERETRSYVAALAAYWSGAEDFSANLCALNAPDQHAIHPTGTGTSPELARMAAERRRAEAALRAAESERVPDVTWSAGVRKFGVDESIGVLGGVSIPLGAPARAAPYEAKAAAEARQLELQLEAHRQILLRDHARLERSALGALDTISALDDGPIPEAKRAVDLANDGYRRGAFSYLDVLDAQNLLFDLRTKRLDQLRTYHLAEAAIARLRADPPTESSLEPKP